MANRYGCKKIGLKVDNGFSYCEDCLQKQIKIDRLEEETKYLKRQLRYRDNKNSEEFFGSSTPSSKRYIKKNSTEENQRKKGGAKKGHKGNNGRHLFTEEEADEVVNLRRTDERCPECGGELEQKEVNFRSKKSFL